MHQTNNISSIQLFSEFFHENQKELNIFKKHANIANYCRDAGFLCIFVTIIYLTSRDGSFLLYDI